MKTLAIIQARMGSTRFPGKVLKTIYNKPILSHIINFLNFSKEIDEIIVATTILPEDDKIVQLCHDLNTKVFRGSSDDVLGRFYNCSKIYHGDLIVRITSDDPIIDPSIVDEVIQTCKNTKCDFVTTSLNLHFPLGIFVEALTFDVLEKLHLTKHDKLSREHVTYAIKHEPMYYNIKEVRPLPELERPTWRLTIDYEEDLLLMEEIFKKTYQHNSFLKYSDIVSFLDNNPEILKINEKYIL